MAQCKKKKKNYFGPWCYTWKKIKHSWAWLWSPGKYTVRQKEKITGRPRQKHSKRSRWGINGRGLVHMQLGWRVIQSRCAGGWGRSGDWEWRVHWGYCSADGSVRIWTTADEKADNENVGENLLILWHREIFITYLCRRDATHCNIFFWSCTSSEYYSTHAVHWNGKMTSDLAWLAYLPPYPCFWNKTLNLIEPV